ncbi:hypothetical protein BTJ39_16730 [Izhakiella australiensis]|uniref:AAA family ATPase n=1 Tax=Izhakiella australiensis TaxID=1926881 RepID=A0A1S8YIH9_9GAMM|nr:hypothetical protein [Izhakiella australiensis]OON38735.1 hypothetical protein BTJ39_16730 [Izhakiella australiensis]
MDLQQLGRRICILGPSNSGKSTLAQAIGDKLQLDVIHLDRLYHYPATRWQARPPAEFSALHQAAIDRDSWVIDGNYSRLLAPRLQRASGFILLNVSPSVSLLRYFRRTWSQQRIGGLDIARDRISWEMIRYITGTAPAKQQALAEVIAAQPQAKVMISSCAGLKHYYQHWALSFPTSGASSQAR